MNRWLQGKVVALFMDWPRVQQPLDLATPFEVGTLKMFACRTRLKEVIANDKDRKHGAGEEA